MVTANKNESWWPILLVLLAAVGVTVVFVLVFKADASFNVWAWAALGTSVLSFGGLAWYSDPSEAYKSHAERDHDGNPRNASM